MDYNRIRDNAVLLGWKVDKDDDKELWLSFYVNEDYEWMRTYDKATHSRCDFNGRQVVSFKVSK